MGKPDFASDGYQISKGFAPFIMCSKNGLLKRYALHLANLFIAKDLQFARAGQISIHLNIY